jgi:hypothetical protein
MRHVGLALAYHGLGNDAESRREIQALIAAGSEGAAYQIAEAYAWRGERDKAFEWLARAVSARDSGLAYVKFDPLLAGLHADSRWRPFLETMKLPVD